MGAKLSGGRRNGCKLTLRLPFGSGCARTAVLGGPGAAKADVAAGVTPAVLKEPLAFARSSVFVRLCAGRVISPDRFLGVSAGTSRLVLGVGKNRGVGRPPTSPSREDSPSIGSAEKACCELFSEEKKLGCSASRGLSYAFGMAGTGGTSKNSSVSSSALQALLSPNASLDGATDVLDAKPVADDVVFLGFGVGNLEPWPFEFRSMRD